jgi:chloramphenicol O-acetyltransferase type B
MFLDAGDNIFADSELDRLHIGKFCSIASGVKFMMGGTQGHNYSWIANYPFDFLDDDFDGYQKVPPKGQKHKGDTVVGNDVWLGFGVTLMAGVEIGDGAVVAANSHVVKNVPPYAIVGGNPAKLIKMRFPEPVVERLLQLKWWDLPDDAVQRLAPLLFSPRIDELLIALEDERRFGADASE